MKKLVSTRRRINPGRQGYNQLNVTEFNIGMALSYIEIHVLTLTNVNLNRDENVPDMNLN